MDRPDGDEGFSASSGFSVSLNKTAGFVVFLGVTSCNHTVRQFALPDLVCYNLETYSIQL